MPRWMLFILQGLLTLLTPVLLTLCNVRLVMNEAFLWIEYTRPGFPTDYYGLTTEERLRYAPYALQYLLNAEGIAFLADLRFADNTPLFNERELQHMEDVKWVVQVVFAAAVLGGVLVFGAALALWRSRQQEARLALWRGLMGGAWLTVGLLATIVLLAVTSWDVFFETFHSVFFAPGTWQFFYSDTLIRLFPEQFWFDCALVIGGLTLVYALGIIAVLSRRATFWVRA